MGSNIQYRVTKGTVSSSGTQPLSGTYYTVGGGESLVDQVLSAGSNQAVAAAWLAPGSSAGDLQLVEIYANQNCTLTTNGLAAADVQTVTITGTPTGGSFVLGFNGKITAPIAYNAIASAVQSALQALATIGSGNMTCSGGPLPGTPVVCTFAGALASGLQPLIVAGNGGLTGGSGPTVAVAHTTPGLPQDTISITAGIPILWDVNSIEACPFAAAVTGWYITNATALRLQARIVTY